MKDQGSKLARSLEEMVGNGSLTPTRRQNNMAKKLSLFAVLALLLVIGACSRSDSAPPEANQPEDEQVVAEGPVTLDDQLAEVAKNASGFGGMFYDDDGILNIYMAEAEGELGAQVLSARRADVRSAIASVFGDEVFLTQARMDVDRAIDIGVEGVQSQGLTQRAFKMLPARYDFLQLREWYREMVNAVNVPGMVFTDIDERANRLAIGVEKGNATAREQVEQTLAKLSLPRDVVIIEETDPIYPAHHTLENYARPVTGGLRIGYYNSGGGTHCTLGFNVILNNVRGFVTNSHCTANQGGVERTHYYQGTYRAGTRAYSNADIIGTESVDPVYWWGNGSRLSDGSVCPSGRRCRWSDSAFAWYRSSVSSRLGHIARTNSWAQYRNYTSFQNDNLIKIDHNSPTIRIVAENLNPLVGNRLSKIGKSTGWTFGGVARGEVNRTCMDTRVNRTDITLLCQFRVDASMFGGDSGSPVFMFHSNNTATLYGILWGGNHNPETHTVASHFIFSPINAVRWELTNGNRVSMRTF